MCFYMPIRVFKDLWVYLCGNKGYTGINTQLKIIE